MDEPPESFQREMQAAVAGGLRNLCTDAKRCGLGMCCEHAQDRGKSVNLISLWANRGGGQGCDSYFPRTELGSTGDVPRDRSGLSRHNKHARAQPPKPKSGLILPPHLQTPPDLGVSRHIKHGRDIKKDDD